MKRTEIKQLFVDTVEQMIDSEVLVKGWVRTKRGNKNVAFIALNDGSTIKNVQIVGDDAFNGIKHLIVGKNYQGPATYLQDYEKVTIPDDNIYLEVRDGFIVNRETKEVMGMLPGAYEDSEDVTIVGVEYIFLIVFEP